MLYLTTWREARRRRKQLNARMRDLRRNGYLCALIHSNRRWLHP